MHKYINEANFTAISCIYEQLKYQITETAFQTCTKHN